MTFWPLYVGSLVGRRLLLSQCECQWRTVTARARAYALLGGWVVRLAPLWCHHVCIQWTELCRWKCIFHVCTRSTDYRLVSSRTADVARRRELFESLFIKCFDVEVRRYTDITGGAAAINYHKITFFEMPTKKAYFFMTIPSRSL